MLPKNNTLLKGLKSIMYNVFLDTNILLDYLISERVQNNSAHKLFILIVEGKVSGYISPISLVNLFYILRTQKNEQERKDIVENLMDILEIVELDNNTMQLALFSSISDYEDALQYVSATKVNADFVITGDEKFKSYDLDIPVIGIKELLDMLK
jgi:predicted nucleic acid-binding protein